MTRTKAFFGALFGFVLVGLASSPPAGAQATSVNPGDLLVADTPSGTIHRYAASGDNLGVFASGLSAPIALTIDIAGNIFVSEYTGYRVDKFSPSGVLLLSINVPYQPGDVEVATNGTIYVADYFAGNVYRYSDSGAALGLFASTGLARADFMALDTSGNLYVTDFSSGSIRRISPTGVDLGNFVTGLIGVEGITFDADGNLYAALSGYGVPTQSANLIEKISPSGVDLGVFASFPFAPVRSQGGAYGLAFDSVGNLYVANSDGNSVEWISPSGIDLGVFASAGILNPRDLVVVPGPITESQCRNYGWRTFAFPRIFRTQGDCIRFVSTAK